MFFRAFDRKRKWTLPLLPKENGSTHFSRSFLGECRYVSLFYPNVNKSCSSHIVLYNMKFVLWIHFEFEYCIRTSFITYKPAVIKSPWWCSLSIAIERHELDNDSPKNILIVRKYKYLIFTKKAECKKQRASSFERRRIIKFGFMLKSKWGDSKWYSTLLLCSSVCESSCQCNHY